MTDEDGEHPPPLPPPPGEPKPAQEPPSEPPWYKTAPWYAWAITAAIVVAIVVGGITGAFAEDEKTATGSRRETSTTERETTTERPATTERETTTTEEPTTTEQPTTTAAPTTTSTQQATTTAAPATTTTELPTDGDMTITPEVIDPWPFTVDSGTLTCDGDAVTFETGGTVYAINGFALQRADVEGWQDIGESDIWIDIGGGLKVYIGAVIDLGLMLCEAADQ